MTSSEISGGSMRVKIRDFVAVVGRDSDDVVVVLSFGTAERILSIATLTQSTRRSSSRVDLATYLWQKTERNW